jgi:chromate reductase
LADRAAVRLLLVSGSTRAGSTNTAALRAARDAAPTGVDATLYDGLSDLPAFNPDDEEHGPPHPAVAGLREQLAAADGVLFCTPEYAGTLPGSLKNLLDWTVGHGDLVDKPVAWVNVGGPGRGDGAQATLRLVLDYVSAVIVEDACAKLTVARDAVGPDGEITDPALRQRLGEIAAALAEAVRVPMARCSVLTPPPSGPSPEPSAGRVS